MQAVVFDRPENWRLDAVEPPQPGDAELLIRVRRAGICGTDVHIYRNEYLSTFPLVPGHELVGEVVAAGQSVAGFAVGDRVAVDPNLYCHHCVFCRNGEHNHCLNWQGVGITRGGAFAELLAAPAIACYRVPESISDAEAAMIEPVSCVVHGMNRLRVDAGDAAVVFGVGPIGLLLVQALRHRGVGRLVAVDRQADRLDLARQLGATEVVEAGDTADDELRRLEAHGYAVVVDATGVPAAIEQAMGHLRPRGRFLQFGVTPRDATIRLRPFDVFRNDWTLLGSYALSYTFEQALAWMAAGRIDVKPLISHVAPLADFGEVFDAFAAGRTLKVHLTPNG